MRIVEMVGLSEPCGYCTSMYMCVRTYVCMRACARARVCVCVCVDITQMAHLAPTVLLQSPGYCLVSLLVFLSSFPLICHVM
jgi:hypothetical protein